MRGYWWNRALSKMGLWGLNIGIVLWSCCLGSLLILTLGPRLWRMAMASFDGWNPNAIFPANQSDIGLDGGIVDHEHDRNMTAKSMPEGVVNGENDAEPILHELEEEIQPVQPGPDPIHPLNWRDVCAFIVNKMIGTGIFIQPPAVLLLTGSKAVALALWLAGFTYTLVASVSSTCFRSCLTSSSVCSYTSNLRGNYHTLEGNSSM